MTSVSITQPHLVLSLAGRGSRIPVLGTLNSRCLHPNGGVKQAAKSVGGQVWVGDTEIRSIYIPTAGYKRVPSEGRV